MPGIAFLFPGQGSQAVGMGAALAASNPTAKALFDQASEVLGYDLLEVCRTGPAEKLNATDISQPAIFVASLAALEQAKHESSDAIAACIATAGLSLGEYTALVFAGALTFEAGLKLVRRRGEAMQKAADETPSGMVSVLGLDQTGVDEVLEIAKSAGQIWAANYLCPGNVALSGSLPAIDAAVAAAEAKGTRAVRLAVAGAFHTEFMAPAAHDLSEALSNTHFTAPRMPVWSNVDAQPHSEPAEFHSLLERQLTQPVLWETTIRNLMAAGVETFYEVGPGRVLAGLIKRVNRKTDIKNIQA